MYTCVKFEVDYLGELAQSIQAVGLHRYQMIGGKQGRCAIRGLLLVWKVLRHSLCAYEHDIQLVLRIRSFLPHIKEQNQ